MSTITHSVTLARISVEWGNINVRTVAAWWLCGKVCVRWLVLWSSVCGGDLIGAWKQQERPIYPTRPRFPAGKPGPAGHSSTSSPGKPQSFQLFQQGAIVLSLHIPKWASENVNAAVNSPGFSRDT